MTSFQELVKSLIKKSSLTLSIDEHSLWINECDKCLETLEGYLRGKGAVLSIGVKQKITTWIVRLRGLRALKRVQLSRSGRGVVLSQGSTQQHEGEEEESSNNNIIVEDIETIFKGRVATRAFINLTHIEPRQFFENVQSRVIDYIESCIKQHNSLKVNTSLSAEFLSGETSDTKTFNTANSELFALTDLNEWYEKSVYKRTLTLLEEFQERDSGWALSKILHLLVNVNKYNPFKAGCYDIKIPKQILLKHATINVRPWENDGACFFWSIMACLYTPSHHVTRQSSYPHYSTVLHTEGLKLPMTLHQIDKFEQMNDISINVFYLEENNGENVRKKRKSENSCLPLRLTAKRRIRHANLLLIQYPDEINTEDSKYHFVGIRNLSRLVSTQLSGNKRGKKICER